MSLGVVNHALWTHHKRLAWSFGLWGIWLFLQGILLCLQEPKSDKDDEFCRKVNEYLNNPPIPGAGGSGGGSGHELSALGGEGGLQNLLGNMSHNQLMQLIGPTGLGGLGEQLAIFLWHELNTQELVSVEKREVTSENGNTNSQKKYYFKKSTTGVSSAFQNIQFLVLPFWHMSSLCFKYESNINLALFLICFIVV